MAKAFVGEPCDAKGNALPCEDCDRLARMRVAGRALCLVHAAPGTPRHVQTVNAINRRRKEARVRE